MRVLALIPARGGSKGVPRKNIRSVDGKPLIAYTIEAAIESKRLSAIYVSSDDQEILDVAKKYKGVELHIRRDDLATDTSPVTDTLLEVKSLAEKSGTSYDALMILQPTAPIRTGKNIDDAISILENNKATNSVISVCAMQDVHPARMYWNKDNELVPILQQFEQSRRQEIPAAYFRNGSIYLIRKKAFEENRSVMIKPSAPLIMPASWLLNIDEPRDMFIAEALIPLWKTGKI